MSNTLTTNTEARYNSKLEQGHTHAWLHTQREMVKDYTVMSLNRIYDNAKCPLYIKQQTHVCDL